LKSPKITIFVLWDTSASFAECI